MKIAMLVVIFLLLGAFFIVSQNNLALNSSENVDKFVSSYIDWLASFVGDVTRLGGFVVKLEWLPDSESQPES